MVEVSEDIFYQVKKEILDKLDIILQRVNLQIINYLHPQEESFSFIELSSFEQEITHLFHYLDRFYASLNTSVSFSSINSFKSSVENYQAENQRLINENQKLQKTLKELKNKNQHQMTFQRDALFNSHKPSIPHVQQLKHKTTQVMQQFKIFAKDIKKALKKYKFDFLESRVQIISKLKDFQQQKQTYQNRLNNNLIEQHHGEQDGEEILHAINEILLIC